MEESGRSNLGRVGCQGGGRPAVPNYGRRPRKLRATRCQTTGAARANYGSWPAATPPFVNIFGLCCASVLAALPNEPSRKKHNNIPNLIVSGGLHCNFQRLRNSNSISNLFSTGKLSPWTGQRGRKKNTQG